MKNIFIAAIMLLSISAKAQLGSALIGVGSTLFVGSSIYYVVGQPKTPTQNTALLYNEYNDKLTTYKNLRTVSMATSSLVLITGIIFKATEVKVSKTASVSVAPTGAALTLRW
jgi:hypothetical protein